MAVDHHFLEGVGVGRTAGQPGDVGDAETQLRSTGRQGRLSIALGNFPERVGPLGVAGQENQAGFKLRTGHRGHFRLDRAQVGVLRHGRRFLQRRSNGREWRHSCRDGLVGCGGFRRECPLAGNGLGQAFAILGAVPADAEGAGQLPELAHAHGGKIGDWVVACHP